MVNYFVGEYIGKYENGFSMVKIKLPRKDVEWSLPEGVLESNGISENNRIFIWEPPIEIEKNNKRDLESEFRTF